MLDYGRPIDPINMCEVYPATQTAPARLETFQVFKKGISNYATLGYSYDLYGETEMETANAYNYVPRDYSRDQWRYKNILDWTENDTVNWVHDCVVSNNFYEHDIPIYNFRIPGEVLRSMRREEVISRASHPNVNPCLSETIGEVIYGKLLNHINESIGRYGESDTYHHEPAQTMLDLDHHKNRIASDYLPNDMSLLPACDSSDDSRLSDTASPDYGSDGSKSGDEEKRKQFKRPPGRPKGSGRKQLKRPKSVSVPEFLRDLLLSEDHCPSKIRWENYEEGKFRFVKPDEVAKLWGQVKQNEKMNFEKFSRAMRYHYRQLVLLSVPSHRLVYQFGPKAPNYKTDNPNFIKVKLEMDMNYS